ncbi:MAG: phosphoribosyl-ATP diphosphatase [Rhizobiales bacterium]|nr:phosphoribosyl-ATP diphosphatase [Hyphomicrobiales bacterium]
MTGAMERLHKAVLKARQTDPGQSRTARLMQGGRAKMAKKLVEEAAEVTIDAVCGDRDAVVRESADLLYNLAVLWVDMGITPDHVWSEMERREQLYGIAEKLHKGPVAIVDGAVSFGAPASGDRKV